MNMWPTHKAECALKQLDYAKKRPDEGALRQRRSIQQNSGSGMNALFERLQQQFDARDKAIRDFVHPARAASARAGMVHNDFFDLEDMARGVPIMHQVSQSSLMLHVRFSAGWLPESFRIHSPPINGAPGS